MVKTGHDLGPPRCANPRGSWPANRRTSPAELLSQAILTRGARASARRRSGQKEYVDAIDDNTIVFGIGPAGTGKTYLAMAKAVQALQRKEVDRIILTRPAVEAGERLGFLPGTLTDKIDPYLRPLLRRAQRDDGPGVVAEAARGRHHRGRPAGLHARPNAERLVHRARRGAEHDAGADEDVPHPARFRLQDGRHRRHHPGRPARAAPAGCGWSPGVLDDIDDIHFAYLTSADVVRHTPRRPHRGCLHRVRRNAGAALRARAGRVRQPAERGARSPRDRSAEHGDRSDHRDQQRVGASRSTRPRCSGWRSTRSTTCTCIPMPSWRSCWSTRPRWSSCTCSGWTSPARPTC